MIPLGEEPSRPFCGKRFLNLQNWRELFRGDKSTRETIAKATLPPVDDRDLSNAPVMLAASFAHDNGRHCEVAVTVVSPSCSSRL